MEPRVKKLAQPCWAPNLPPSPGPMLPSTNFGLTPLPRYRHLLESMATESLLDLYVPPLIDSTSKEVMIAMAKSLAKLLGQPHMSSKLHRHLKKAGHSDITLKDIQESLSGIGVSLSKRVIEERNKR